LVTIEKMRKHYEGKLMGFWSKKKLNGDNEQRRSGLRMEIETQNIFMLVPHKGGEKI
jgi:hypothetical protein